MSDRYVYTVRSKDGTERGRAGHYWNNRCLPFATRHGATALANRLNRNLDTKWWTVVTYKLTEVTDG